MLELPCPQTIPHTVRTLVESGGRVDWSAATGQIAFDRMGEDGYYDVFVMDPDGTAAGQSSRPALDERCLTCGQEGHVPQRHNGNPAWHPSGEYIVFQAEKEAHRGPSRFASPGLGFANDLWLVHLDSGQFTRLTDLPDDGESGVLHPHFSPDGGRLSWSEMVAGADLLAQGREFGTWRLMLADFTVEENGPGLSNVREVAPGGNANGLGAAFYENHGFSPDGSRLLFSSNREGTGSVLESNDVYVMDLASQAVTRLTDQGYNEHASYSPDGTRIVWMSNAGGGRGTDYWLMAADGSGKEQLTYFNRPGCPEYRAGTNTAADNSWSPDGRRIAGYVQTDLLRQEGRIVIIELLGSH